MTAREAPSGVARCLHSSGLPSCQEHPMALFCEGQPCPLCCRPILSADEAQGFTFVGIDDHRFSDLDDAVVHLECTARWEYRDEFVAYWNRRVAPPKLFVDTYGRILYRDEPSLT